MGKIAFMFPGQGAQYIGMGKTFFDEYECSRACVQEASKVTGLDIEKLVFEENDMLNKTEYTQVALYTIEMAMYMAVKEMGITSDVNIGLSLGEYGALTASGGISFSDASYVVRQRGIFMENEVPAGIGSMAAVIGMTEDEIDRCLLEADFDKVTVANYNCPGQIVISGEKEQVREASALLKEAGAKRVIELNVSGPFHSIMLKGAGEKLGKVLKDTTINDLTTPYVANYNASYVNNKDDVKELLEKQVYSSVRFWQSIKNILNNGVDTFVEIGPGKTLTGFVKKIAKDMQIADVKTINIEKTTDLEQLKSLL